MSLLARLQLLGSKTRRDYSNEKEIQIVYEAMLRAENGAELIETNSS